MGTTTDPQDPRLTHGVDTEPTGQAPVYLVLSEQERAQGFQRPFRDTYRHVGAPRPQWPLRDLTEDERARYEGCAYVAYEPYPPDRAPTLGRYWTQAQLDAVGDGCLSDTVMAREIAETYARQPAFYGATYCVGCRRHLPVAEFVWVADGTRVGS